MNKAILTYYRTVILGVNLKNTLYGFLLLATSLFFLQLNIFGQIFSTSDLRLLEAFFTNKFLILGIVWIIGIPALLYFCYQLTKTITQETTGGIALLIFTRPIGRREYLVSRSLGIYTLYNIINGIILLLIPALQNLLFKMPKAFIFPMYKVALGLFIYGLLISLIITSLSLLFSMLTKRNLLALTILFLLILLGFFTPTITQMITSRTPSIYPLKPAYSIIQFLDIKLLPQAASMITGFTGSYITTQVMVVDEFINALLSISGILLFAILCYLYATYALNKYDIM